MCCPMGSQCSALSNGVISEQFRETCLMIRAAVFWPHCSLPTVALGKPLGKPYRSALAYYVTKGNTADLHLHKHIHNSQSINNASVYIEYHSISIKYFCNYWIIVRRLCPDV